MDPFFTYVAIGAVVILVVVLIAFGVMMSELHTTDLFPPTYNTCPDYWAVDGSGQCVVPGDTSMKNRGLLTTTGADPHVWTSSGDGSLPSSASNSATNNDGKFGLISSATNNTVSLKLNDNDTISALYPSISDRCSKKQWALNNQIVWDGVTNYNAC